LSLNRATKNSRSRPFCVASALLCLLVLCGRAFAQPVRTQHLTVELVTETTSIAPSHDFLAGLHFVLDKGWHIYWINAGDAGLPPRVDWRLPAGITAGEIQFPAPQRLPLGPLMDFGYENQVLLPIPMRADGNLKPGSTAILRGHLHFLVCSNVCIPGQAELVHKVAIAALPSAPDPKTEPLFIEAERRLPISLPAGLSVMVSQTKTTFVVTLRMGRRIASAEFYPFDPNLIANAAPQIVQPLPDGVRITIPKAQGLQHVPSRLHGLIKLPNGTAYQFTSPITIAPAPVQQSGGSLPRILGLAFLGGLILNLMPCVFPVLFIKGLSLVQSSGEERRKLRAHGAMYTLGILVSFWIMVAVLLALRAGGTRLGWGFQFQSPYFVAFMALLFFFLGLSLAGQFEIGLSWTSAGGELAQRGGYTGSFFTGVLATVVATPCMAPLLGAAVGFALSQAAIVTFAVFTLLALGLAAPYVLLTVQPVWARFLPRPGPWMEYLKQAVSIPIFAAMIWMIWVFGLETNISAVAALLGGLLVTAIAGWVLGHWPAKRASAVAAVVLLIAAIVLPVYAAKQFPANRAARTNVTLVARNANYTWQPFSPELLATLRGQGKPVFVDFSAAWCLSCQVNERAVLDRPDVEAAFRKNGVVMMRADWTNHDDAITAALAQLGRSGVPTYALYSGDKNAAPQLLPEVLTKGVVLDALQQMHRPTPIAGN
jgi:thiol:disulfide interchange protein/DsbC/DsbD-like thiol-disulfide interchange protein